MDYYSDLLGSKISQIWGEKVLRNGLIGEGCHYHGVDAHVFPKHHDSCQKGSNNSGIIQNEKE